MGRAMRRAVQLPATLFIGFFIIVQQLTALPFKALATPNELLLTTEDLGRTAADGIFHRSQFPKDFLFGSGTSAYQVEGAPTEGGKGVSMWDKWSHTPEEHKMGSLNFGRQILNNPKLLGTLGKERTLGFVDLEVYGSGQILHPSLIDAGKTANGDNGDVAVDEYHRYEEDLDLVAAMNMDSYRFSIAWTRILPNGTGPRVNMEGVDYYNRVIDATLARGLTPMVTLYHWDLPQALLDSYDGWLSPRSVDDFAAYAEACFTVFGDRVKHWTTFNEPGMFVTGYGVSSTPPGRTINSSTEPYIAAHNVLLAHAAAVDVYRRLFQEEQGGVIGITLNCFWGEPLTNSTANIEAAERYVTFQLGWFLDPLYFGDYPKVMRRILGYRLPLFSEDQVLKLRRSLDFIGLNYYTSRWVTDGPDPLPDQESSEDLGPHVTILTVKDGHEIGPQAASRWLFVVPWGLHKLLKWTSARYNAPMLVTENGYDLNDDLSLEESLHDSTRIQFYRDHLSSVLQAVREGVDVRGYFAWSLLDNFEWHYGYYLRFGLIYVDYKDNLKRYSKDSSRWFTEFLDRTRTKS